MTALQYTLVGNEDGSKNLTVFRQGDKPLTAHSTHPNFDAIIKGLLVDDDNIVDLFDVAMSVGSKFERLTDRITVHNGQLFLDGEQMDNSLVDQILRFLQEGVEDWKPLVLFYENMLANPNQDAVKALYDWLSKSNITITDDGMILGYKGLKKSTNADYGYESGTAGKAIVDGVVYEGNIPQDVGAVVEMPRSDVDFNPRMDCGVGLHVGNYGAAQSFAKPGLFEVHVNPRDVVSVPDHGSKIRCCRYVIVKSAKEEITKPVVPTAPVTKQEQKKTNAPKVNIGDVYRDRDPRRPRDLKVKKVLGGMARVENVATGKTSSVLTSRLQNRFDRIKRGR